MVSPLFVGVLSIYLSFKYGLLTSGARNLMSVGLYVAPTLLSLLARVAFLDATQGFDVLLVAFAALPVVFSSHMPPLTTGYIAALGAAASIARHENVGVQAALVASAVLSAGVQLVRMRQ